MKYCFFYLFWLLSIAINAQNKTIKGRLLFSDNKPAIGFNINDCSGNLVTKTGLNGIFTLIISDTCNHLIVCNEHFTQKININKDSIFKIQFQELDEVVVTAMQLSTLKRAAGYSIQVINEKKNDQSNENPLTKLQTQVSGAWVQNSGGAPGQSIRIVLRGNKSIEPLSDNQPLFILNGMPIDNSTNAAFGSGESFAYSNRLIDINSSDITNITVLKGPSASSLYGMQASNGAILLKTKQANESGFHVTFSSGLVLDKVTTVPKQQTKYMAGWYGKPNYLNNTPPFHSFGPLADTLTDAKFYNNLQNFFQTGIGFNQNLSISDKNDKSDCYISLSNLTHDGVISSSSYGRKTIMINLGYNFTKRFHASWYSQYSHSKSVLIPQGNNSEISSGAIAQLYYFSTSYDVRDYIKPDGTMKIYSTLFNSPLYLAKMYHSNNDIDRFINTISLNYKISEKTSVNIITGIDKYLDSRDRILPGPTGINGENPISTTGEIQLTSINYSQLYSNLFIRHNISYNNFNIDAALGNEIIDKYSNTSDALGQRFNIPEFYDISNTATQRVLTATEFKKNAAIYGYSIFSYKNLWYTTLTGRQEWSSTLPVNNRSFFYPSINSSFIFSEMNSLQNITEGLKLNFGQLRFSYAQAGKDARPYQTGSYYSYYDNFNNSVAFSKYSNTGSDNLKPERTHSYETGSFLSFFDNRFETDITLYKIISNDMILSVPISNTTGYSTFTTNSGSIINKGLEVSFSVKPIKSESFKWQISIGYTRNVNQVVELADSIKYIELPGSSYMYGAPVTVRIEKGYAYGNIYGTSYARYNPQAKGNELDKNAPLLIDSKGFPIINYKPVILGNINPDYILTLNNTFNFKHLQLSLLIEYKKGGDVFNQAEAFFASQGTSTATNDRDNTIIFDGFTNDGKPNQTSVWLGQGINITDGKNYGDGYYRNVYRKVAENFVEDASWLKIRDINISYSLNSISKHFESMSFYAGVTNLILWTHYKGFDPEASQYGAGSNIQGLQGRGNPGVSSFYVGFKVGF